MGTKFFSLSFFFVCQKNRIFAVDMVNISKHTIERSIANLFALPCCVCNLLIINQLAPPPLSGSLISENHKNMFLADEFLFGRLLLCANLFTLKKYLL